MVELNEQALSYADKSIEELEQLILTLCRIPAPSHQEDRRAEFICNWFIEAGGRDTYIDEAKNVICPYRVTDNSPVIVFMAHTDTVFPDLTPFEPVISDERITCPGVGDDTSNLAVLMLSARYLIQSNINSNCGVLFVANSCEEGLGNLKGSRQIMKDFGSRVKMVISFDGYMEGVTHKAVGSHRYRITIHTEGGHSYANFGNRNAIQLLSSMINTLYTIKIPSDMGHTTYNVGKIEGGTSINTIAQDASMLYEYRSDDRNGLYFVQQAFEHIIDAYRAMGIKVDVDRIGERPCSGKPDKKIMQEMEENIADIVKMYAGFTPRFGSGSTDCNIPLSQDIPSLCPGVVSGGGAHTREEYIIRKSLRPGLKVGMGIMLSLINLDRK